MLKIFGIKQCSTMQKAFAWLDAAGLTYEFHDYKKLGIDTPTLQSWCQQAGWEKLVNTKGTTWRKLTEADRSNLDEAKAIQLMLKNPSLIKRPVVSGGSRLLVGFDINLFSTCLKSGS